MANLKDLRVRIKSVKSTKKITSAMKMIAAAKLKKAEEAAQASRPYADEMMRVLARLAQNQGEMKQVSRLLTGTGKTQRHVIVVVSSNRGLCGGFNAHVVRLAKQLVRNLESNGKDYEFVLVGRKATDMLKREFADKISKKYVNITTPRFFDAEAIADDLISRFEAGAFDVCHLLYNKFESALSQVPSVKQLIPVEVNAEVLRDHPQVVNSIYEYEPSQERVFNTLLKRNVRVQVFKCMLESAASEHGARMAAMDGATRNANDMIHKLNLTYNRTRQAVITKELIEIISGAEAL